MIEIAIIDNGINDILLKHPVGSNLTIEADDEIKINQICLDEQSFMHGTNCAMIMEKYIPNAILHGIRILDNDGKGIIDKLQPALDWCWQNNVQLVNLSLGTTHFQDKKRLRGVINHYANRGMVIVAASANSGYRTYPASFANVIGVASGDAFETDAEWQKQKGIDFTAPSDHEIEIEGASFRLGRSNSYAAPYVTAMIGKLLEKESCDNVCRIRKMLMPETGFFYVPDWIETAWVSERCERSRAEYYFEEAVGELQSCMAKIDTIVIKEKQELEKYHEQIQNKNIVYLGKEPIEHTISVGHFWSREQRIRQVAGSRERESDIDVPLILCRLPEKQDVIFWLNEFRDCFGKDGYHLYTASVKEECVLYDLEFLPEELCNASDRNQVYNFLYWQTYYCQSDAVLLGVNGNAGGMGMAEAADMVIEAEEMDAPVHVKIYCGGKLRAEETVYDMDHKAIEKLYGDILKLFAEDTDE